MTIEIQRVYIDAEKQVHIEAVDVSEERLMYLERRRMDDADEVIEFVFDTKNPKTFQYLHRWFKRQKRTENCSTWGEALHAVQGIITDSPSRYYRVWE